MLMSIHIVIQLLLVSGAVLSVRRIRATPDSVSLQVMLGTIVVMMFVILDISASGAADSSPCASPEIVLLRLFPVFEIVHYALRPFSRPAECRAATTSISGKRRSNPTKEEETSEEEIQAFIDAGQEEGILERDEGEMIQSIVHFGDKVAREVMTPRTQIVAIDINSSVDKLLHLI